VSREKALDFIDFPTLIRQPAICTPGASAEIRLYELHFTGQSTNQFSSKVLAIKAVFASAFIDTNFKDLLFYIFSCNCFSGHSVFPSF
jgi:hypothetical protein